MEFKNVFLFLVFVVAATSCSSAINDAYFHRIKENKSDFHKMTQYLLERKVFAKRDSIASLPGFLFDDKYVYADNADANIRKFMSEYELRSICFDFKDSVLIYKKDHGYFNKPKWLEYDFGKSPLRQSRKKNQCGRTGEKIKIMDSCLIYHRGTGI